MSQAIKEVIAELVRRREQIDEDICVLRRVEEMLSGKPEETKETTESTNSPKPKSRRKRAAGEAGSDDSVPATRYVASMKDIRHVLEDAGEPLSAYRIKDRLEHRENIKVTEAAVKKLLDLGAGKSFKECEHPDQGKWVVA